MFEKILIALGIRKKVVPDTQARRNTDKVDFPESEITEAYASGKLPKRTGHTFVGKGHLYYGGTQVPPKAPPPFRKRLDPQQSEQSDLIVRYDMCGKTTDLLFDSPPCEAFAGKGGEFSGAGASGSWDSPSTSSSDTSSCSPDSGSSPSCGSD